MQVPVPMCEPKEKVLTKRLRAGHNCKESETEIRAKGGSETNTGSSQEEDCRRLYIEKPNLPVSIF